MQPGNVSVFGQEKQVGELLRTSAEVVIADEVRRVPVQLWACFGQSMLWRLWSLIYN